MYGLPEDLDPDLFLGRLLEQVCVGRFQLILRFDEGVSVNSACDISVSLEGEEVLIAEAPAAGMAVIGMLGAIVCSATGNAEGTLALDFGAHGSLRFFDCSEHFESYTVEVGERTYVI